MYVCTTTHSAIVCVCKHACVYVCVGVCAPACPKTSLVALTVAYVCVCCELTIYYLDTCGRSLCSSSLMATYYLLLYWLVDKCQFKSQV